MPAGAFYGQETNSGWSRKRPCPIGAFYGQELVKKRSFFINEYGNYCRDASKYPRKKLLTLRINFMSVKRIVLKHLGQTLLHGSPINPSDLDTIETFQLFNFGPSHL